MVVRVIPAHNSVQSEPITAPGRSSVSGQCLLSIDRDTTKRHADDLGRYADHYSIDAQAPGH